MCRRRKIRIGKGADSDANMAWKKIRLPINRGAAFGTEMGAQFAPLLTIADEGLAFAAGLDLRLAEIGTHTEDRAGPALAIPAVAGNDKPGLAFAGHLQIAATA